METKKVVWFGRPSVVPCPFFLFSFVLWCLCSVLSVPLCFVCFVGLPSSLALPCRWVALLLWPASPFSSIRSGFTVLALITTLVTPSFPFVLSVLCPFVLVRCSSDPWCLSGSLAAWLFSCACRVVCLLFAVCVFRCAGCPLFPPLLGGSSCASPSPLLPPCVSFLSCTAGGQPWTDDVILGGEVEHGACQFI